MEAIMTTFNKNDINQCTDRCIVTLHHKQFTPDELNCFQKYFMFDLDALATYQRTLWAGFDQIQKSFILSSLKYEPPLSRE
jgi:hypothetical protein